MSICRNCGCMYTTRRCPRWCVDCWRMALKTATSLALSAALTWAARYWLTLTKLALGWVFN